MIRAIVLISKDLFRYIYYTIILFVYCQLSLILWSSTSMLSGTEGVSMLHLSMGKYTSDVSNDIICIMRQWHLILDLCPEMPKER